MLEAVGFDAAIESAAQRIAGVVESHGAGVVAGIASGHATNEDLFTFRRFLEVLGTDTLGVAVVRGEGDDLLIKEERAPNGVGARALGFPDAGPALERMRNGGVRALVVLGHDVLHEQFLGGLDALANLDTVIVLDSHVSALERVAHVVLPTRVPCEKLGTLTNHAGRVQRVQPAVEPLWEARSEGEIVARLGAALALPGFDGRFDAREISRTLAESVPAFAGCDWDGVGPGGRSLEGADG